MYIGPWQEYRLAKIQDDAIQRLRKEWEDQLREQLPESDDTRIRELMQPMLNKLPSLLLASKAKSASSTIGSTGRATRPSSSASSVASSIRAPSSRRLRDEATATKTKGTTTPAAIAHRSNNNQETHEEHDAAASASTTTTTLPKSKPKPKPKAKVTKALNDVQRRQKLFAKWLKSPDATATDSTTATPAASSDLRTEAVDAPAHTRTASASLPPLAHPSHHQVNNVVTPTTALRVATSDSTYLPPIRSSLPSSYSPRRVATAPAQSTTLLIDSTPDDDDEWSFLQPYDPMRVSQVNEANTNGIDSTQLTLRAITATTMTTSSDALDDSLDEDAVNNLLNWTDELLSPSALDEFNDVLDDDVVNDGGG